MKDSQVCKNDELYKWHYDKLLTLRNEENKHYWDSVRLILASQAGLLGIYAVTFDKLRDNYPTVIFFVSLLGLIFSVFLFQIIRAGMYWVIYWQKQMVHIEKNKLRKTNIFIDIPTRSQGKKARKALHFGVRPVDLSLNIQTLGVILIVFWLCLAAFSIKVGIVANNTNRTSIIQNNNEKQHSSYEKLPESNNNGSNQKPYSNGTLGAPEKNKSGTISTKNIEQNSMQREKANKTNSADAKSRAAD